MLTIIPFDKKKVFVVLGVPVEVLVELDVQVKALVVLEWIIDVA